MRRSRMAIAAAAAAAGIGVLMAPGGYSLPPVSAAGRPLAQASQIVQLPCGRGLSALRPGPGTVLELQRGCGYPGTLSVAASGVTVTAYGTGPAPVITTSRNGTASVEISGSDDTISNLSLVGLAPGSWSCHRTRTPAGHVDGIDIESGALSNTITNVSATGFYAGVYVMSGSTGNLIENSTFTNNTELDANNAQGSAGAFGILLWGSYNTITGNTISGNQACSIAYGYDGSAIEVFGGSYNLIDNNQAVNDNAFTELGSYPGATATGNTYQGNNVSDGPGGLGMTFLVTRGSQDPDGPVYNTVVTGNTVRLSRPGDEGVVSYAWQPADGTLLTLAGNDLNLGGNQVLYQDGGYLDGGGNTFTGTCVPSGSC